MCTHRVRLYARTPGAPDPRTGVGASFPGPRGGGLPVDTLPGTSACYAVARRARAWVVHESEEGPCIDRSCCASPDIGGGGARGDEESSRAVAARSNLLFRAARAACSWPASKQSYNCSSRGKCCSCAAACRCRDMALAAAGASVALAAGACWCLCAKGDDVRETRAGGAGRTGPNGADEFERLRRDVEKAERALRSEVVPRQPDVSKGTAEIPSGTLQYDPRRKDAPPAPDGDWLSRTRLLVGDDSLDRLARMHVLVVGLGGVGGNATEWLVRGGIGHITIVDGDVVDPTNRNHKENQRLMPSRSGSLTSTRNLIADLDRSTCSPIQLH